ncbi:MAG: aminotransferase class V-fold PLP-dependent enzyme [Acidimicrobiales bacterium]|nr:aminotransferase class V-fold PLP-dependent enzyme [Acidimicrobiales bacterium]
MTAAFDLGPFPSSAGYDEAVAADAVDPLRSYRDRFVDDDPSMIYLDGNSLGRLPHTAVDAVATAVRHEWGSRLIRSWNERWWSLAADVGGRIAPLIGAAADEVIVADSTTVNLHKLATAAMTRQVGRSRVVTDDLNFPSDVHVLRSVANAAGALLQVVPSDGVHGPVAAIVDALDEDVALLSLSATVFKSGYTYDLAAITAAAHEVGALVLWDLSHSVGAVELDLAAADADLAVGCTYKFLNGGPGSPAFLYVRRDLQDELRNPIAGWWGDAEPFEFGLAHDPAPGIARFQTGTAPILSLIGAEAGVGAVGDAGIDAIAAKGRALVARVEALADRRLAPLGVEWVSPRDPARRGAHAALAHEQAWQICQALIDVGRVIPDFRAPDNIRLGLSPLTTSHLDAHTAIERLARVIEGDLAAGYPADRAAVT